MILSLRHLYVKDFKKQKKEKFFLYGIFSTAAKCHRQQGVRWQIQYEASSYTYSKNEKYFN